VLLIEGVLYELPVCKDEPPEEVLNQLIVLAEVAVNTTLPGPHLETLLTEGDAGIGSITA